MPRGRLYRSGWSGGQPQAEQETTLRSLVAPLYLPGVLYAAGQWAVIPVIAFLARHDGASVPMAGVIVGLRGVGTMVGDLPAGAVVNRLGDRRSVMVSTVLLIASGLGAVASTSAWLLAVSVFAMGAGWAIWLIARLAYATDVLPPERRGQGIATLGGASRIGNFLGPLVGAAAIPVIGTVGTFWIEVGATVVGCAILLLATRHQVLTPSRATERAHSGLRASVAGRASVLLGVGPGALAINALRTSRQALLPLWAAHVGIDAAGVSLVFGVSSALDMMLFAPAGYASDRWGRKVMAISCLMILALGHLMVPMAHDLVMLMVVGLVLGFGNGLGSGIVMTIGADIAPESDRAAFLGVWRFISDTGTAGGPFLLSAAIAASALMPAAFIVGGVGLVTGVFLRARMPETGGNRQRRRASTEVPARPAPEQGPVPSAVEETGD